MKLKDQNGREWRVDTVTTTSSTGESRIFSSGFTIIDAITEHACSHPVHQPAHATASDIDQIKQEIRKNSIATNPKTHECRQFYGGYEVIPDDLPVPQQTPHVEDLIASNTRAIECNTKSIESLNLFGESILKRVKDLESERAGVAEVIQSHGVELEQRLKMDSDILKRIESIELEYSKAKSWINTIISDNQRLKERLNAIEGIGIPR